MRPGPDGAPVPGRAAGPSGALAVWRRAARGDDGSAVVEFVGASVLLLVPLVYLVLVLGQVQAAAFAADGAAREAARAMVTGPPEERSARALAAAGLALADQGIDPAQAAEALTVHCSHGCDAPGTTVTVEVVLAVGLVGAPRAWADRLPASIAVSGHATGTLDRWTGEP